MTSSLERAGVLLLAGVTLVAILACGDEARVPDPSSASGSAEWSWRQYASPEQAGWSSVRLDSARQYAREIGSTSVMLVHDGVVVVAWGPIDLPMRLYSVRKSLVSALYGPAVSSGAIELDATLGDLGVEERVPLRESERSATVRDLLQATSGVYLPAAFEPVGNAARKPERGSHPPGEHWYYNNWDFNLAGRLLEMATGRSVYDLFASEIAEPIGMQDYRADDGYRWLAPSKSLHPALLFRLSARDAARFGQLFLQGGEWNGRNVLPEGWVAESTEPKTRTGNDQGYAYMWWNEIPPAEPEFGVQRYTSFSARGNGGQRILIIPELDIVFVHLVDRVWSGGVDFEDHQRLISMLLEARIGDLDPDAERAAVAPDSLNGRPPEPEWPSPSVMTEQLRERVTGAYRGDDGEVAVYTYDDRLFLHAIGMDFELFHDSAGGFVSPESGFFVEFDLVEGAPASAIEIVGPGGELRGERVDGVRPTAESIAR